MDVQFPLWQASDERFQVRHPTILTQACELLFDPPVLVGQNRGADVAGMLEKAQQESDARWNELSVSTDHEDGIDNSRETRPVAKL